LKYFFFFTFGAVSKVKSYLFEWIMYILLSVPFIAAAITHFMANGHVKHDIRKKNKQ